MPRARSPRLEASGKRKGAGAVILMSAFQSRCPEQSLAADPRLGHSFSSCFYQTGQPNALRPGARLPAFKSQLCHPQTIHTTWGDPLCLGFPICTWELTVLISRDTVSIKRVGLCNALRTVPGTYVLKTVCTCCCCEGHIRKHSRGPWPPGSWIRTTLQSSSVPMSSPPGGRSAPQRVALLH